MDVPVKQAVTHEEIAGGMRDIMGHDFGLDKVLWSARYRSKQRLAARYRQGRVFLLGDAAHTHVPAGGQGLQIGIGDAANLAWKLAGTIKGRLSADILDSYENERKSIAAAALRNTDLLFRFNTASGPLGRLLHWFGLQTTRIPYVAQKVVSSLAGDGMQYRSLRRRGDHRLVGRRLPLLDLLPDEPKSQQQSLTQLLREGRFVLIHHQAPALAAELRTDFPKVYTVKMSNDSPNNMLSIGQAILVRPDGVVIWVGNRIRSVKANLEQWLNGVLSH